MNDQILAVSIEARINKLEKEMKKAAAITGRNFDVMEKRSKRAAGDIEKHFAGLSERVGGMGKAMVGGFVGGLTAGGILGVLGRGSDLARDIAEIGDEAKRAGLSLKDFQELKYVAEQNRIGVDSLVDGIKELNLRADEFVVTGGGSAAEAFGRLGYDAETLKAKLKDPSALFTEIIGKLEQLDRAAAIRIADELFGGTGGERFVQLIERGADAIDATRQEARDLGLVMSDELVAAADELDRRFNTVASTVGTALKTAIVEAAAALGSFIERFQAFEQQSANGLSQRLREIGLEKLRIDNMIVDSETRLSKGDDLFGINRGALEAQIATGREQITKLVEQEQEILAILASRKPDEGAAKSEPILPIAPTGNRGSSTSAIRAERDAAAELITELENELRLVGMSEVEQRINAELRRADANATDAQKQSIRSLVLEIGNQTEAMSLMQSTMEGAKGVAKEFLGGLLGDLRSGVDGATALANAFGRLADKLLDMALDGMINSLFASLMGGSGGVLGFGGAGIVKAASGGLIRGPGTGTSDDIPARLSNGEFVVNAAATSRNLDLLRAINDGSVAAFAGGGLAGELQQLRPANDNRLSANENAVPVVTINAPITVNGSAGTPEQNADLAKRMARELQNTVRGVVSDEIRKQGRPGNMLNTLSLARR